jgi:hypothetical protein
MIEVTEAGKVIYKTEHNAVGRFPEPGDDALLAGPSRNFQVFDPLDFLAEVTQHVPDPGEHLIRYYGWYSNKSRGQRAQRQPPAAAASFGDLLPQFRRFLTCPALLAEAGSNRSKRQIPMSRASG